jgi:dCTP deaminase
MSTIMNDEQIKIAIKTDQMIENADEVCIEGIKYDFRLGTAFLKSYFGRAVDFTKLREDEKRHAIVEPGETVYVLTAERLNLPKDVFVRLSPKRKLSHDGIQLWGGLTIDPGYKGYLLFGLCNLSSTNFTLEPGRKLVGATFERLDESETMDYAVPEPLDDFPTEIIHIIKDYKPLETRLIFEELRTCQDKIAALRRELDEDITWKENYRKAIDDNARLITKISDALDLERQTRKEEAEDLKESDDKLRAAISSIDKTLSKIKGVNMSLSIFLAFIAVALAAVAIFFN